MARTRVGHTCILRPAQQRRVVSAIDRLRPLDGLCDKHGVVTEIYAERDRQKASESAREAIAEATDVPRVSRARGYARIRA